MHPRRSTSKTRRRGAVAAMVVMILTVVAGFAALTIDVGALYNAKSDLQGTVDSSALAAAGVLSDYSNPDPKAAARAAAAEFTALNGVMGSPAQIDPNYDVTFGRADFDSATNTFTFVPTEVLPDAVRVQVRLSADSPNGEFPLFFGQVLGLSSTAMTAEAIAMFVPRDIAIVADLSGSHTDDSELQHYDITDVNLYDVWGALPGGIDDVGNGLWDPAEVPPSWVLPDGSVPQAAGPGWGYFKRAGWGDETIDASYNPVSDAGLVKLQYGTSWSDAQLAQFLADQGYVASEITAILTPNSDNSYYKNRVAVGLGLAFWNSGHAGGLWEARGVPPAQTGNGNDYIGGSELDWHESIFGNSVSASASIWNDYISYMKSTGNKMYQANSSFRYRFGAKTFTNFLLEKRASHADTPELADTPTQPMQAVKDAVVHMTGLLDSLDSNDQLSLEIYGTTANHEVDLTLQYSAVSDRLTAMQAAHYNPYTNIGGGLAAAITELTGPRARSSSRKVIVLLTDGIANVDQSGNITESGGAQNALAQAAAAASAGIRIYAVSVGAGADQALMDQIAQIGEGSHFHAAGSVEQYSADLVQIFETISGDRQVTLIQ